MENELSQVKKIREVLSNYNYYKKMIGAYKVLLEQEASIKGVSYEQERTQSTNKFHSDVESNVLKKDELLTRMHNLQRTINKVDSALSLLDSDERIILQKYYIEDLSWVAISHQMHVSERQCIRVRDDAIDKMQSLFFSQVEDKGTGNIQLGLTIGLEISQF